MSKLDELIKKLCPNGVEYKKLIEITSWDKKFNGVTNNYNKSFVHISAKEIKNIDSEKGNIKLISTGNFDGWADEINVLNIINEGEIITLPSGGTANIKYFKGKFIDSGNIIAISVDVNKYNTKYIYYNMMNKQDLIQNNYRGSGIKHPDMKKILAIEIPIPPLEVQCEIVKILDTFTLLTAELTARKKQYEYYRDELLSFDNKGGGNTY